MSMPPRDIAAVSGSNIGPPIGPSTILTPSGPATSLIDAIADAATTGMGLAWLPSWLVRERIQAGELVQVLPDQPAFLYDAYALWLQTPHLPRKVRLAVDALVDALPRLMT
jgi:DNA-binding transcriptional LysR family regulator